MPRRLHDRQFVRHSFNLPTLPALPLTIFKHLCTIARAGATASRLPMSSGHESPRGHRGGGGVGAVFAFPGNLQDILQPPIGLLRLGQRRLHLGEAGLQQGVFARKISCFHGGK